MDSLDRRRFLAKAAACGAASALGFAPLPTLAQPYPPPGAVIIAPREPPPPRYEVIPPPPHHRRDVVVWSPGHWRWTGRGWVWVNGRYVTRPRREAIWVPGHWEARGPNWVWIPPHWQ
jgi:hypothetical protein